MIEARTQRTNLDKPEQTPRFMAQKRRRLSVARFGVVGVMCICACISVAQVPNVSGQMATPIPGVGHHYLGLQSDLLTETVNPATGSVSVRLTLPTPPSRGMNIPFSLVYNSSGLWQLQYSSGAGEELWENATSADNGIGWSYSFPLLTLTSTAATAVSDVADGQQYQVYSCDFLADYVFQSIDGSRHELPLSPADSPSDNPQCNNTNGLPSNNFLSGSDDDWYFGSTTGIAPGPSYNSNPNSVTLDTNPPPVTVSGADGTVYKFSSFWPSDAPTFVTNSQPLMSYSSTIEDRNGNIATVSYSTGAVVESMQYQGSISYTDTSGRTAVSVGPVNPSNDQSTVNIAGLSQPLTVQWGSVSSSFEGAGSSLYPPPNGVLGGCSPTALPAFPAGQEGFPASVTESGKVPNIIQSVTLPNGQAVTFSYDSATGLLQQITYPTGAYIRYTWGANPLSEVLYGTTTNTGVIDPAGNAVPGYCDMTYGIPAVVGRDVSYDGVSVALHQAFSYSTVWPVGGGGMVYGWSSKSTTVTTTDNIDPTASSVVTYNYEPVQSDWQNLNFGVPIIQDLTPVEASVQTQNSSGQMLRTITKNWLDQYTEACAMTTLDNGSTNGTFYTYGPYSQVTDDKEFDYGLLASLTCNTATYPFEWAQSSGPTGSGSGNATPTKEIKTAFDNIANLTNGGMLYTAPSSVRTYGAGGALMSETDVSYDQSALASANPPQFDTQLAAPGATVRGNPTTITKRCWPSCQDAPSYYTWDIAGQLTSNTDAVGNTTCFSHQDNFVGGSNPSSCNPTSSGSGTDSYLTMIDPPHANGVSHATWYQYTSVGKSTIRYRLK